MSCKCDIPRLSSRPPEHEEVAFAHRTCQGRTNIDPTVCSSDEDHGRQRRALSHAFSNQAPADLEPTIQGYMTKVFDHLRLFARNKTTFGIGKRFINFMFDTMGDLAFRENFGCLDEGKYQEWVQHVMPDNQGRDIESLLTHSRWHRDMGATSFGAQPRHWRSRILPCSLHATEGT